MVRTGEVRKCDKCPLVRSDEMQCGVDAARGHQSGIVMESGIVSHFVTRATTTLGAQGGILRHHLHLGLLT